MVLLFRLVVSLGIIMFLVTAGFLGVITGTDNSSAVDSDLPDDRQGLVLSTNKPVYKPGEEIAVFIENKGSSRVGFDIAPKIQIKDEAGIVVYPKAVIRKENMQQDPAPAGTNSKDISWEIGPDSMASVVWNQKSITSDSLLPGGYSIETVSDLPPDLEGKGFFHVRDMGYVILACGNNNDDIQDIIDSGCNDIYDALRDIGYSNQRILYLNGWSSPGVDMVTTSDNIEWGILTWAAGKVAENKPLFLIMYDHGGNNFFCCDNSIVGNDYVTAANLVTWMNELQLETNADIHLNYVACSAGTFIDEVSKDGRVTITSSRPDETSKGITAKYNEYFSHAYWPEIISGKSVGESFNAGSYYTAETCGQYHPILDDNGNYVGHGWDTPEGSGHLPHDGDGYLAKYLYMGGWEVPIPELYLVIPETVYTWPPPGPVPVWADIDPALPISQVKAGLVPPETSSLSDNLPDVIELIKEEFDYYDMSDPDQDGHWTVNIPASAFDKYRDNPGEVRIIINAEDRNGITSAPFVTRVTFTPDGNPAPDRNAPGIRLISPNYRDIVRGETTLSGVVMDDSCVSKLEVYTDNKLFGSVQFRDATNAHFEFDLDTKKLADGISNIQFKAFDKAGNTFTTEQSVAVVNSDNLITPEHLRCSSLGECRAVLKGDKQDDFRLTKAIDHLESAFDEDLWVDELHLDPQQGHKVYVECKDAVMELMAHKERKDTAEEVKAVCDQVIINILTITLELAYASYDDLYDSPGDDTFTSKQLEMCDKEFAKARNELILGSNGVPKPMYHKAADHYRKAWQHSTLI